jgi:membrane protein implicated in regulation of membrane protease activity
MRENGSFLLMIAIAAIIVAVFVVPYLADTGHKLLAIPLFAFLALLAIYGRHNPAPRPREKRLN